MNFKNTGSHFVEQNISFSQWREQVAQLAAKIALRDEQQWLLYEQDSYLFSVSFFALVVAKKSIVLPPNGQPQQLQDCMEHADIFIGSEPLADRVNFSSEHQNNTTVLPIDFCGDVSVVFFTSGSSGTPKAISKTFGELITEVEQLEQCFGGLLGDVIMMSTVSHQHIYGMLFKLLWPIWVGRDVYLSPFEYPEHLAHQIKQQPQRQICLISSPAYYHRLVKDNVLTDCGDQIVAMFSSGGPLDFSVAQALTQQLATTPHEVFGSTETGGIAWRVRQNDGDKPWQVFDNIVIDCDEESQRLSIKSPYINGNDWFLTDDRVQLVSKNQFKLLGRADRIVKIEEKRCSLDEIELKLKTHHFIEQAHVLLVRHPSGLKRDCLGAAITLTAQGKIALTEDSKFNVDRQFKNYLKLSFEALVIPRKFRHLEQLPFNAQGKLNKKQLEQMFE